MDIRATQEDYELLINAYNKFNQVLSELAIGHDPKNVLSRLTLVMDEIFPNRISSILLLDPTDKKLYPLKETHCKLPEFFLKGLEGADIGPEIGSCGAAAYYKRPFIVSDTINHSNWSTFDSLIKDANLRACWSVPFFTKAHNVAGTFAIYSHVACSPSETELELLETAANIASIILETNKLQNNAMKDNLSGLNNRFYFFESFPKILSQAKRNHHSTGLAFIDLDNFKIINDSFGHSEGDKIIAATANSLLKSLRTSDLACRYGGDEFVFAAININEENMRNLCDKFRQHLLSTISNDIKALGFGVTIGAIIIPVDSSLNSAELLKLADNVMYQAKKEHSPINIQSPLASV